ncbi:hypothetical protein [Variovorax paradoxus]|uniref:hypothetical protein n=1 Tax=Variovorax paradoxus TaxID=34073 RepID=UPI003D648A03
MSWSALAQAQQANGRSALPTDPMFQLGLDSGGCLVQATLNDVPLLRRKWAGFELTLPIDQWLQRGRNTLELRPMSGGKQGADAQACKASASIWVRGGSQPESANARLLTVTWPASSDVSKKSAVVGHLDVGKELPVWRWTTSDPIPATRATRTALRREYRLIWEAVRAKKVAGLLPAFAERNREMGAALRLAEGELERRAGTLQEHSMDPALEQVPLEPEDAELVVFANGRLAKLTRWDGSPMIAFSYKDGSGAVAFDIVFRRERGKWLISR